MGTRATEVTDGRADLRQDFSRHAHFFAQLVVPVQGVEVHEQGARGVGDVGQVQSRPAVIAPRAAGEVPQQPGVDGAGEELAALGPLTGAVDVVEDPRDLRPGRVGVGQKAGLVLPFVRRLVHAGGARVLPDDRVVDRPPGLFVPHHGGFALVGNAQRFDVPRVGVQVHHRRRGGPAGVVPDLHRVVLNPALARQVLLVLDLRGGFLGPGLVDDDAPRGCGALVDGGDISHPTSLAHPLHRGATRRRKRAFLAIFGRIFEFSG